MAEVLVKYVENTGKNNDRLWLNNIFDDLEIVKILETVILKRDVDFFKEMEKISKILLEQCYMKMEMEDFVGDGEKLKEIRADYESLDNKLNNFAKDLESSFNDYGIDLSKITAASISERNEAYRRRGGLLTMAELGDVRKRRAKRQTTRPSRRKGSRGGNGYYRKRKSKGKKSRKYTKKYRKSKKNTKRKKRRRTRRK